MHTYVHMHAPTRNDDFISVTEEKKIKIFNEFLFIFDCTIMRIIIQYYFVL